MSSGPSERDRLPGRLQRGREYAYRNQAQAIALYALGHSCRNVEGRLKAMLPGEDVPNYATIARWVRVRPGIGTKLRNQHTVMRW
jgi:hypothetical protein